MTGTTTCSPVASFQVRGMVALVTAMALATALLPPRLPTITGRTGVP